jgi:hypothetical protein
MARADLVALLADVLLNALLLLRVAETMRMFKQFLF